MAANLAEAIAALDKRDCALLHEFTLAAAHKMHELHHHRAARVMEALESRLDA